MKTFFSLLLVLVALTASIAIVIADDTSATKAGLVKENMKLLNHLLMSCTAQGVNLPDSVGPHFWSTTCKNTRMPFINPVTGNPDWPVTGKHSSLLEAERATHDFIGKGRLEYTPLKRGTKVIGYLLRGGNPNDGLPLSGNAGRALVITGN